jgi:hypothetical protein
MVRARPASPYNTQPPRTNVPGQDTQRTSLRVRTRHRRLHNFPESIPQLSAHTTDSCLETPIAGLETHEDETAMEMFEISCRVVGKYTNSDPDQVVFGGIEDVLKEGVLASRHLAADFRILDPSPN